MRPCQKCGSAIHLNVQTCPDCGGEQVATIGPAATRAEVETKPAHPSQEDVNVVKEVALLGPRLAADIASDIVGRLLILCFVMVLPCGAAMIGYAIAGVTGAQWAGAVGLLVVFAGYGLAMS